ncbi:ATP phosphoribosyltransferase regulatory subunit [Roseibium denhamense]|uniref:ATP phosphoribosyltransferase regulatory subunit n=2 Tax=Roseibium denhamense TaxID=76305 RepID=A0ABY1P2A5_9HYPH|nr:ATP phosphoribosyltransferase regulatory subunit [Roseibium denhamense]MTI07654.1 ATP phosphoribosyltransferase regulatory subunit [Roseibium denhamense]SMP24369.1 ATP phosphoribosyltransferase regulatory subunit [Roseibium denhamense]
MTGAQQGGLDPAKIDAVLALFQAAGHHPVTPAILQPADVFLDLTGEDIRRRLFLTNGTDGIDLCLRPDFTIPVCRHHLADPAASLPAAYSYHGPVFRQRADGLGEIPQIGAESLGRTDIPEADADLLALSVNALDAFGLSDISIRIGDETLFAAVLAGLDLPNVWRRRLRDLFGETDKLTKALERMSGGNGSEDDNRDVRLGFLSALEGADPEAAHAVVEDLLSIAGISAVGGRTPSEIAERFLEQAALANGASGHTRAAETLSTYLALSADGSGAAAALKTFAKDYGLGLDAPLSAFERRLEALTQKGIDPSKIRFSADFGRRLDYYSGFVFEIHSKAADAAGPLVGGGRYDKLVTLLGSSEDVPAIGFSMWLDRIAGAQKD